MTECQYAKVPFDGATCLRLCKLKDWLLCPEIVWKENSGSCPYLKKAQEGAI